MRAGRIEAELLRVDPSSRVLDVAMTAFPSQPLCWAYVSIESNGARIDCSVVSPARRRWLAAETCPAGLREPTQTVSGSLQELRALKANNCHVDAGCAWRMPIVADGVLSDYRFATTPRGNFTSLPADEKAPCPQGVPAWSYPRADLF
jgi:inner membrane protein